MISELSIPCKPQADATADDTEKTEGNSWLITNWAAVVSYKYPMKITECLNNPQHVLQNAGAAGSKALWDGASWKQTPAVMQHQWKDLSSPVHVGFL